MCCGLVVSAAWAEPTYKSKNLNPQHQRELQRCIDDCATKVNKAVDPESRSLCQEELCKRMLQAEDYDNALKVATAIAETEGINPERRAAHHYLTAQIYALKMEASPNLTLMEDNRRQALITAEQVRAKNYDDKWMINEAVQNLTKRLNDPKKLEEIAAWVRKRQFGDLPQDKIATANAQSNTVTKKLGGFFGKKSGKVEVDTAASNPARDALVAKTTKPVVEFSRPASSVSMESDVGAKQRDGGSKIGFSDGTKVVFSEKPAASTALTSTGPKKIDLGQSNPNRVLQSPIIISGMDVRAAEKKVEVNLDQMGRPWPKEDALPAGESPYAKGKEPNVQSAEASVPAPRAASAGKPKSAFSKFFQRKDARQ